MSEIKLLPCPFCGGEAMLTNQLATDEYGHKLWNVLCVKCDNGTSSYWDKNHVVEKWNTRKPMQEIVEMLEGEMRNAMKDYKESSDIYDLGVYQAFKDAVKIVNEVGGMND